MQRLFSHKFCLVVLALCIFLIPACASKKVERVKADSVTDLSGRWNDTDSRLVAEAVVKDLASRPWINDFIIKNKNKPRVIVGTVLNNSNEHIAMETFTKDLERELLNDGRIIFVSSEAEREGLRKERKDQQKNASEKSAKGLGKETAADFMLIGTLTTIVDREGGDKVTFYQIDLELHNIENNEKIWIGQKKIKKIIERSGFKL